MVVPFIDVYKRQLQGCRRGGRPDDPDVDHPVLPGASEQALHLGPREAQLAPDLDLGLALDEIAVGDAHQELLVGAGARGRQYRHDESIICSLNEQKP